LHTFLTHGEMNAILIFDATHPVSRSTVMVFNPKNYLIYIFPFDNLSSLLHLDWILFSFFVV